MTFNPWTNRGGALGHPAQTPGVIMMNEPTQADVVHRAVCRDATRYRQQFCPLEALWGVMLEAGVARQLLISATDC